MHGNTDGAGNLAVGYAPMYYGTNEINTMFLCKQ